MEFHSSAPKTGHVSPLRYPGGKGFIAPFLQEVIERNYLRCGRYFEPYAGGAGAALRLLIGKEVNEVFLNDLDPLVYSFWKSILTRTDEFVERILTVPLTIAEWYRHAAVCNSPEGHTMFDVGFATFFLNRCNRSGVLRGAGPIGGFNQSGEWKLDARFYRGRLAERVQVIAALRDQIHISNFDGVSFLKRCLPRGKLRRKSLVYLDPPYVSQGDRLYFNSMQYKQHRILSDYVISQKNIHWLMSYDDHPCIRSLYCNVSQYRVGIEYSMNDRRVEKELLIAPGYVTLPKSFKANGKLRKLLPLKSR